MLQEEKTHGRKPLNLAAQVGFGSVAAFIITLILLILFSFGISQGLLSERHVAQLTLGATAIGVFIGALLTNKSKQMLHGLLVGGCFACGLFAVKLLIYRNNDLFPETLIIPASALFAGALAGFVSKKGKRGAERRGKRRRK